MGLVDDSYRFDHLTAFPFLLITLLIVEALFMRFLLSTFDLSPHIPPAAKPDNQDAPARTPDMSPRMIEVGDRRIRVDNLRYIASEEHYLRVVTKQETLVQRAKLGDVIDQLHDSDGVRPHRSWWVCRHACPRLTRDGARATIHLPGFDLPDLAAIPVARSRLQQVQDWFDFHMDW
ncbi:LytTR family transcriptional regulator [Loktanella sp. IMCC34160]|uniref:LytTR family DNA-binding domain-containing protein n=1 Tax=Loktanella sp. IMCC34160 TaxID=2510646 RepID=UPI00101D9EE4|nr:LytTR family DNA-binding domain-containing protein [Loktanella sp. IMCC34160]RYG92016.1 LytTR family transcriptional regulator [Loktanella sp. IMCC34160]